MKHAARMTVLLLAVLLLMTAMPARVLAGVSLYPVPADAGFFGGDSDFDFDPGGWGDSGSFDFGDSFSVGGGGFSFPMVIIIIVVVIIVLGARKKGSGGSSSAPPITTSVVSPQHSTAVADQVRRTDPFFTEAEMREKVANLYTEMQYAWASQNWQPMRARMTDDLFSQMNRQLQELISRDQINKMERISVMNVALKQFYQDEQHDNLVIRLTARVTDYTVDRKSGQLVSGDPKREKFMTYDWTMIRSAGLKTPPPGEGGKSEVSRNCPHCGAPIELTQSARCEYCGSIVTAPEFDWVLSSIREIAQQTI